MPTRTLAWQTNPHALVKGSIDRVPNIMTTCGKGSRTWLIVSAQWILRATRLHNWTVASGNGPA